MAATKNDWVSRMQKRNDLAMAMLRRPSETGSRQGSISSESHQIDSPLSPRSCHSLGTSSLGGSEDLYILELQFRKNEAQMKANEMRMRKLKAEDEQAALDIQEHVDAVMQVNHRLRALRDLLTRMDQVSKGQFGVSMGDF